LLNRPAPRTFRQAAVAPQISCAKKIQFRRKSAKHRNGSSQTPTTISAGDRSPSETSLLRHGYWNSTVGTYRLYCLDGVEKVASAEWIEAQDDEDAMAAAEEMRDGRACELWQNSRLVARIDSGSGRR
jgi:hypothetical protein